MFGGCTLRQFIPLRCLSSSGSAPKPLRIFPPGSDNPTFPSPISGQEGLIFQIESTTPNHHTMLWWHKPLFLSVARWYHSTSIDRRELSKSERQSDITACNIPDDVGVMSLRHKHYVVKLWFWGKLYGKTVLNLYKFAPKPKCHGTVPWPWWQQCCWRWDFPTKQLAGGGQEPTKLGDHLPLLRELTPSRDQNIRCHLAQVAGLHFSKQYCKDTFVNAIK